MKISHNQNFPAIKHRCGSISQVWWTGWSWAMCCSQIVQTGLCQGYMTWLTGRGRKENYWLSGLWIIWKEHRKVKPVSLVYLGSSSLPTKKWWDALWTTHLWAAFDVPLYSPWSSVSCNVCQDLKFCSVACKISESGPSLVVCFTEQPQTLPPPVPLDIMPL